MVSWLRCSSACGRPPPAVARLHTLRAPHPRRRLQRRRRPWCRTPTHAPATHAQTRTRTRIRTHARAHSVARYAASGGSDTRTDTCARRSRCTRCVCLAHLDTTRDVWLVAQEGCWAFCRIVQPCTVIRELLQVCLTSGASPTGARVWRRRTSSLSFWWVIRGPCFGCARAACPTACGRGLVITLGSALPVRCRLGILIFPRPSAPPTTAPRRQC